MRLDIALLKNSMYISANVCIFLGYGDTVRNKARTTFPNNWGKGEIKNGGKLFFL